MGWLVTHVTYEADKGLAQDAPIAATHYAEHAEPALDAKVRNGHGKASMEKMKLYSTASM